MNWRTCPAQNNYLNSLISLNNVNKLQLCPLTLNRCHYYNIRVLTRHTGLVLRTSATSAPTEITYSVIRS